MKKIIALLAVISVMISCFAVLPVHADDVKTVAHWKLQNVEGYFVGDIEKDELQFIDLSGNGNDLVSKAVGNGSQLDIFTWDDGVDKGESKSGSALKMNNTKVLAAAVDPYTEGETSWTGGYTSGKYLETIKGSPLNSNEFDEGFSIDIIVKLSPELDNDYNRYCGIFSRQGVIEDQNEPPFSIALSEWKDDAESGMIGQNKTWMQYVHCDDAQKVNVEMDEILIGADEWHHILVSSDGFSTTYYIDGEPMRTIGDFPFLLYTDPNYSWEVGVGRKWGAGHENECKNEDAPEGIIRRLFAGSISEIRVMDGPIEPEDSLYYKPVSYSKIPEPATPKEYNPDETTEEVTTEEITTEEVTEEVTTEDQTTEGEPKDTANTDAENTTGASSDKAVTTDKAEPGAKKNSNIGAIIGIIAGVVVVAAIISFILIKKKKK
jgi:hypothetical protein